MPTYTVKGPTGASYTIDGPDGATADQLGAVIMANVPAERARSTLHDQIAAKIDADPISQGAMNFARDMPLAQQVVAGYGKAGSDIVRGVGQRVNKMLPDGWGDAIGLPTQASIDEHKQIDNPLMKTGGGFTGNLIGNVVDAAPAMFIPGANGVVGAAATGAVLGGLQPTATGESALKNAAVGGAFGAGGSVLAKAAGAGYRALKAVAEPFSANGPDQIAGRTLARFAADPSTIAGANSAPTVTGALPTLAEQTGDSGIARLQDAMAASDPAFSNALAKRTMDNNAARVASLSSLGGDSTQRAAAVATRQANAAPRYAAAAAQQVNVDPALADILARPSAQAATARAAKLASEQGRTFGLTTPTTTPASTILGANGVPLVPATTAPGQVTGQTLQDLKMGMDALLKDPTSGIAGQEGAAIGDTRNSLVNLMENKIPDFKAARTGYAADSQPVNAIDVGNLIAKKATSNTSDLAGNPRLMANAFLGSLRDEPALIENAIGKKGITSLDQVFTPPQMNLLGAVKAEADRAAAVGSAGNGAGSATAQRLASKNILDQIVSPNVIPAGSTPTLAQRAGQAVADNTLANTIVGKATNWMYSGIAEPKIQEALSRAILSPDDAKLALAAAARANVQLPASLARRLTQQAAQSVPAAAQRSSLANP